MALNILYTPPAYSSVHDDLIWTVSETVKTADPSSYPNYKFIGDVYINSTLVARIRKIPDPVTKIGVFNVGQIVRNYITTVFNPTGNLLVSQQLGDGVFSVSVTMKFGEEYNFTSYVDVKLDTARTFFNNYNGRLIGTTTSLSGFTDKVVSSRPSVIELLLTSSFCFVPYLPTSTSAVSFIVTPSGGGTSYSTTFTPSSANVLQSLNISPVALNALQANTINASTKYYTVQIGAQTYRVNVICESIYTVFAIHFLNQYGGFETKLFTKVSRKQIDITSKDYGRLPYEVDSSGQVTYKNTNNVYYESRYVYSKQYSEKLVLNSDILTDEEYAWLEDLILSPMVYVQDGTYFFPCQIKENNYEPKKVVNDELTNLVINIEYGNQLISQQR